VTRVPLTADPEGPVRTEVTIVVRDPTGTRDHHLALYRSVRQHFGMTRKRLSKDDLAFVRRVRDTAHALATTREGWAPGPGGGPRTPYEGAFWTAFRTRHRMGTTPSVRALGMRWRNLQQKLALGHAGGPRGRLRHPLTLVPLAPVRRAVARLLREQPTARPMLQAFAEDLLAQLRGAPATDPEVSPDARPAPDWPEADDPEDGAR
jgi:hypothetical protein